MKPEAAILGFTMVMAACGAQPPQTTISDLSNEAEPVPTIVALASPLPTPTRIPIGVIEEERAGLYPRNEPEEAESPWGNNPQPDSDGAYRFVVGGKVTQPILKQKPPSFLERFAEKRIRGGVIVAETIVKEDGTVGNVKLLRGVDPEIDQAFLDSLKEYTFEPATLDGKPVPVKYILTLRIHLQ